MNSLTDDQRLRSTLDRLHRASEAQEAAIADHYAAGAVRPTGYEDVDDRTFWRDKYVAIDRDKAEFVYALARLAGATRIVEAGTSFGVSTMYLAAAVRDNGGGLVTTCDIEATKAAEAGHNLEEAGLADLVEIRVGDIRETLAPLDEPVDLLLLDIWAPIAGDVLAIVAPHLRVGGAVLADNTTARRELYGSLLTQLEDPDGGFTTQTLPFDGGLELAIRTSVG